MTELKHSIDTPASLSLLGPYNPRVDGPLLNATVEGIVSPKPTTRRITQADATRALNQDRASRGQPPITQQAVSKMVNEGALVPTGPDGLLTEEDLAGLIWAHKVRDMFGFKLDQLRPFVRLVQRDDKATMRRCVFVLRRLPSGLEQWTVEVFAEPMAGNDAEMRRKVAKAESSPIENIKSAFNLERFARDTFQKELRDVERERAKARRREQN